MRKSTYFLSMMLAALLLAPQTIKADDCQFTPAALPGQTSDRTAYEINVTMQVGDGGMVSMQYGSLQNLATTNANVAALHSRGMGVYMVGVGTADVTYSEQVRIDRTNSCTTDHTIHYTVQKGNPVAYFAGADGSALTEYNLALQSGGGDAAGGGASTGGGAGGEGGGGSVSYWTPGLVMNIKSFTGMGFSNQAVTSGITYASSNPSVAAIDASTGAVTVQGIVGETTISATWAGDANWNGTTVSYNLIVKKQATMYFNPGYATDTVGNTLHLEPIINTPGVTVDAWESSNEAVATVDNSGNVTMVHFGNAYIDAIFNGNNEYAPTRCRFYLTVSKRQPHISFTPEVIRLEKNVTVFEAPVMNKPADLTQTYNTTYEWSASDPYGVASVDAETGAITLNGGTGTATIIYVFKGDDKYLAQNARYYIEVSTSGITVMGTTATTANNGDIFGDGSVIYTVEHASGNKYITLHKDTFDANGGVFIQSEAFLSIKVQGNCVIKNAMKAINSSSAVFVWCENRKDTIKIEAGHTAISAAETKIHDCYLFANGGQYGIDAAGGITVSAGGYVFAHGGTEAIRARNFTKGEDNIGGIQIMTKGVEFVSWLEAADNFGGFYSDYSTETKAKFVELGKVPLPVSEDAVTDIDFSTEDPDENLNVVFSGSENDIFNALASQLEINSITMEADVNGALALYVTCSSEWLKLLPGVLVFDVPAGQGEMQIQCQLAEGTELKVLIEGKGSATITQASLGWAKLQYDVTEQTHVIVYLQAAAASPAPKRITAAKQDATPGAIIKAIKIVPQGTTTEIESIEPAQQEGATKFLRNNQVLILRGDKTYTVTGQEVK